MFWNGELCSTVSLRNVDPTPYKSYLTVKSTYNFLKTSDMASQIYLINIGVLKPWLCSLNKWKSL